MSEFEKLAALFAKEKLVSDEGSRRLAFIDTGIPHLNYILSGSPYGGLPQGKITQIVGESMSGKTVLLSQLFIAAQKMGGLAGLWDHEESYEASLSERNGLLLTTPHWLYRKGVSFENTMTNIINYGETVRESGYFDKDAPILAGIDSFAMMIPQSQLEKNIDKNTMNDMTALPRVAASTIKVYNKRASDANITSVFLNQYSANMDAGMYGPKVKIAGGKKVYYATDTIIAVTGKKGFDEKNKTRKFRNMTIEVVKSRTVYPGDKINIELNYDPTTRALSFDIIGSYVDFLSDLDIWQKNGAWYYFNGEKFQGTDQLKAHYRNLPDGLEQLKKLHQEKIDKTGLAKPTSVGELREEDATEEAEA